MTVRSIGGQAWAQVGKLGNVLLVLAASCWWSLPVAHAQEIMQGTQIQELVERLNRAESSIIELGAENLRLQTQVNQSFEEMAKELETASESKSETDKSPEKKEKEKDKKKDKKKEWYEKISLRGYAQLRYNHVTDTEFGSASAQHAGDSSIEGDQEFFLRRARLIFFGDVTDHLSIYLQPDFASTPNGAVDSNQFTQIRDWYGDVYLDTTKIHRFRVGQSKIPYGFENLQSSSNRLPLDRADGFNSAAKNERDLGVFYYWTPQWAQDTFKFISDENLKGSGNYGVFGFGAYNGQGGSLREFNDELHLISRFTLPLTLSNGQIVEAGIQGYTGRYVVLGSAIRPLGVGPAVAPLHTRNRPGSVEGLLDQRLGWSMTYYPQPFGIQMEHTIGRGPELNAAQTAVERGSLHGGHITTYYRYQTPCHGELWPFARYQYYRGGYKNAANAPTAEIDEWSLGLEWQMRKEIELVTEYLITDRTNLRAASTGRSYDQFEGQILRFQFQLNF